MSDNKPLAYYDPTHDKLLWSEGPQYVHAQRTEGMSLKPLYLHPPRPEPARKPIDGDEVLKGFEVTGFTTYDYRLRCFTEGVRFAEKYHGIGVDDE